MRAAAEHAASARPASRSGAPTSTAGSNNFTLDTLKKKADIALDSATRADLTPSLKEGGDIQILIACSNVANMMLALLGGEAA